MWSQIRSTYAWILLSVIVLPLFPAAWAFAGLSTRVDPTRARLRVLVSRWVSLYARLTPLYRFRVEGRDHIPASGPYVLIANHESGLDVLSMLMLHTPARFLAESWMFRVPLAGALFRRCRHIPVTVDDRESGRAALAEVASALAERSPVAIFPEGRLSPDGISEFRPGAFVAAQRAGVPIVPILLEGAGRAWRPGTMVVEGRHEIRIAVQRAIPASEVSATSAEELSNRAREQILGARRASG